MSSLASSLSLIVGEAFAADGLPAELGAVRISDRPDLAQFQCNGAMTAAKLAGKPPREIASSIAARLQSSPVFAKIEIAGPGFINLTAADDYIAGHLAAVGAQERLGADNTGAGRTVVLDYGGPNIAKPMHVGHLRTAIIGEAVRRMCLFAGYKALSDVHMGDWGTHMGMIISEYIRGGQTGRILDLNTADSAAIDALMSELMEIYPSVSAACKEDEARRAEALEATLKMQNGEEPYHSLWKKIRDASVIGMKRNYDTLFVHFDLWKGEADAHPLIAPMVEKLKTMGLAQESEGALIVPVEREDDNKEMPPLILYKRDGAVMYGTTDLATLVERMDLFSPSKILYFVDQRQHLHFTQVFRAAYKSGIVLEGTELTHAGNGTMNGPDGKPFKTRAGGVMKLEDMIALAMEKARERLAEAHLAEDMDNAEREDVAHKVAVSAIKFADLQNQRTTDYIFDIDRFASFEGKTGPYLLYQVVRMKSLIRKAGAQGARPAATYALTDADRPLALLLGEFPDFFETALRHYMPHHLCDYAYRLANAFSSFYASCHILSEPDKALQESRLALCDLTRRHLQTVLELLGIEVPERM